MVPLDFRCAQCGQAGLTPEVTLEDARLLVQRRLHLRCPRCGSVISITTPEARLLTMALEKGFRDGREDGLRQETRLAARLERKRRQGADAGGGTSRTGGPVPDDKEGNRDGPACNS